MTYKKPFLLSLLLCLLVPMAHAAETACPALFDGGKAPDLVDTSLSERTTAVCYIDYSMLASGVTKGPLWSAEHLTLAQIEGAENTSRTGSFHADPNIPAADRSELADYKGSGYDRGHMTPAGDAESADAERETFSLANVVPQDHTLNTGRWERIESQVRDLATSLGEIYVVTGPRFDDSSNTSIGGDDVIVPTKVWKAVYEPSVGAAAYLCTNSSASDCSVVPVQQVIDETGIDPFPALSASVKATAISLPLPD